LVNPHDRRMFTIASAFRSGYTVDQLFDLTKIDRWFLFCMKNIVEKQLILENLTVIQYYVQLLSVVNVNMCIQIGKLDRQILLDVKKLGFADRQIAACVQRSF